MSTPPFTTEQALAILKVDHAESLDDQRYMARCLLRKARAFKIPIAERPDGSGDKSLINGRLGRKRPSSSPFEDMLPLEMTASKKHAAHLAGQFLDPGSKKLDKHPQVCLAVTTTTWTDTLAPLPPYTYHAVVTANNILGFNQKQLHNYPYFGEWATERLYDRIHEHYDCDISQRGRQLWRLQQAWHYEQLGRRYLAALCVSEEAMLYHMLVDSCSDKVDELDRKSERWQRVLARLQQPEPLVLQNAATACETFRRVTGLSIWYLIRKSKLARLVPKSQLPPDATLDSKDILQSLACRICHMHDCMYHGELCEVLSGDEDDNNDKIAVSEALDIDWPPNTNRKRRVALAPRSLSKGPRSDAPNKTEPSNTIDGSTSRKPMSYQQLLKQKQENPQKLKYYPCHHPGLRCDQAPACKCFERGTLCEKACGCDVDCYRRFRGCTCRSELRRYCYKDDRCGCFLLNRECDVDLCSCGVADVLDPENRHDEKARSGKCRNAAMQLGIPRRTLLGRSGVHGFGLFAGEAMRKNNFIGEYRGEVLNEHETERRAQVYNIQNMSFIFALNKEQDIDSALVGNKMRFINHATGKRVNVYIGIYECNMSPRIGMFAHRDIECGEELLFNYGPSYHDHLVLESTRPFQMARIGVGIDGSREEQAGSTGIDQRATEGGDSASSASSASSDSSDDDTFTSSPGGMSGRKRHHKTTTSDERQGRKRQRLSLNRSAKSTSGTSRGRSVQSGRERRTM